MNIAIIGAIPPPFGGGTIYVKRFMEYCSIHRKTWQILVFDPHKERTNTVKSKCDNISIKIASSV
jgi:hypothetical protein